MLASLRTAGLAHGERLPDPRPLPDSPDLEQLRKQAKDLLRAARADDRTASTRFRILPSLANASDDELARAPLALHDAHSVSAQNYVEFGIGQARRGWLTKDDVVNTRTWKQLEKISRKRS